MSKPICNSEAPAAVLAAEYPPLEAVNSPTVITDQAAYYLNRRPQTLRIWASRENGPVRPLRVNGRLGWPVAELKRVLGVSTQKEATHV